MSEVEKLRALLAEALSGLSREQVLNEDTERWEWVHHDLAKRIKATLAEPLKAEYSQDEVNEMTTDMIALRKEYEKNAYRRGAEAMREAAARQCETASPTHGRPTTVGSGYAAAIRSLPTPEDKP